MRKTLIATALLAATIASSTAFANSNVAGVIKTLDMKTHMLTLADGSSYKWPDKFKIDAFKVGEKVQLSWDMKGQDRVIDTLKPAS